MIHYKTEIAKLLQTIQPMKWEEMLEIPKEASMGDYALPCFKLAKEFRKAPAQIAEEIQSKLNIEGTFLQKVDVVGGYINFTIKPESYAQTVLTEIQQKKETYGTSTIGNGKNIVIDYSAPNIAKPFHIGHLRSTVIGNSLYRMYQFLGYHVVGVNHIGDYGTQFGKLIEAYKRWGSEYNLEEKPIDALMNLYVRINEACKQDETILQACRDNFKKLEEGDPYCKSLWETFRQVSLKEFQRVYDLLDITFDSWNGEAFYSDKMPEVIEILEKTGKLKESEGAKIIELGEDMPPLLVKKSNDSTTYATRDLAAILYRARTYDFDKALYLTSYEQNLHFKQVFEVAKLLGLDEKYTNGLEFVPFGMVLLKTGRMSTREGNVIQLDALLEEAIQKAKQIIEEKNPNLENKEEVAQKVGVGAVIFNDLSASRIKDEIFDWDTMLNFNGETGPYIQYIYVRTKSILEKATLEENIDYTVLTDEASVQVLKTLYRYQETVMQAVEKNEPSIVARYLIELAQNFSSFYTQNRIIGEEKNIEAARLYLTYATNIVLHSGATLLGMKMPSKM